MLDRDEMVEVVTGDGADVVGCRGAGETAGDIGTEFEGLERNFKEIA